MLKHLAMESGDYKDIITNLTEGVEQLPINYASLTTKLRDAMKLNLEMAKKLNLKATQAQDHEEKIFVEKVRKIGRF